MSLLPAIWLAHVVHAFWQTSIAAVALLAICALIPARQSRLRHALLAVAMLKFALPPMLPLPTGLFSAAPPAGEIDRATGVMSMAWRHPSVVAFLFAIHLCGLIVALTRLVLQMRSLDRIRRSGDEITDASLLAIAGGASRFRRTRLVISSEVPVPMTFGIFAPVIAVPLHLARTVAPEALASVVAHEAEHVRAFDAAWNLLAAATGALWWFHPGWHLVAAAMKRAREERCDDAVVSRRDSDRASYVRALSLSAACVSERQRMLAAQIGESRSSLLARVERLAGTGFAPSARLGTAGALVVAAVALMVLPGLRISRNNRVAFDRATRSALHLHSH